ncbi:MAG TPA: transglycosylase domain-containing protein, partial [Actinomycetota bacterium]|nr:transglycosylase domain-containing protein [Actinomycetota bacterium]
MARLPRRVAALALALVTGACTLPPIDLDEQRPLSLRSTVRAADGSVLARLYRQNRALVPLESVPDVLIDAVLAAEDARFFDHPGFDIRSIARAALVNASEGTVEQGGSTITQQYVKNVYFRRPPRTFERKARELRLALEVEKRFSKRTILERYLNTIYLGSGAYGVEAASENLFGHSVRDANLVESALIAAVIKAPTLYDPRSHPKRARERRNYVLDRMASLDEITPSRARRAKKRGLGVQDEPPPVGTRQPYFVEAVKREILSDDRFGATDDERARLLWTGGIQVETTLVPELQRAAERSVRTILNAPGDPEAAIVSIEPSTGRIVAMVGGRDWN